MIFANFPGKEAPLLFQSFCRGLLEQVSFEDGTCLKIKKVLDSFYHFIFNHFFLRSSEYFLFLRERASVRTHVVLLRKYRKS